MFCDLYYVPGFGFFFFKLKIIKKINYWNIKFAYFVYVRLC